MNTVYLLTGGNVGNRRENLEKAVAQIENSCGKIVQCSGLYETDAWGKTDQPPFLKQALHLATNLPADELLDALLHIEQQMGRIRAEKNGARTIDIDILFYNRQIIDTPNLRIPHPRMSQRRFVLRPLTDIAASFIHPVLHKTIQQLLDECADPLAVNKFSGT